MEIGQPQRTIVVEPLEEPAPTHTPERGTGRAYAEHLYLPRCFVLDPEKTAQRLAALYDVPAQVVPALGSIFVEAA